MAFKAVPSNFAPHAFDHKPQRSDTWDFLVKLSIFWTISMRNVKSEFTFSKHIGQKGSYNNAL